MVYEMQFVSTIKKEREREFTNSSVAASARLMRYDTSVCNPFNIM